MLHSRCLNRQTLKVEGGHAGLVELVDSCTRGQAMALGKRYQQLSGGKAAKVNPLPRRKCRGVAGAYVLIVGRSARSGGGTRAQREARAQGRATEKSGKGKTKRSVNTVKERNGTKGRGMQ